MTQEVETVQKFFQFISCVDPSFWSSYATKKIDKLQLNSDALEIRGFVTFGQTRKGFHLPPRLLVNGSSLEESENSESFYFNVPGHLYNVNKKEEFRDFNKKQLSQEIGKQILNLIHSGNFLQDPNSLFRFFIISFADLKKFNFIYWFCFPCVIAPATKIYCTNSCTLRSTKIDIDALTKSFNKFYTLQTPLCFWVDEDDEFQLLSKINENLENVKAFCLVDSCSTPDYPGWYLRQLVVALATHFGIDKMTVWCLRELANGFIGTKVLNLTVKNGKLPTSIEECKTVGWEKNKQKNLPKQMDLKNQMDPVELMGQAQDLNLKLMRWRQLPSLDLDSIQNTKALLLGCGTLGCNVARNLMAWGFRNLVCVDNGRVSYSNPARQNLYTFEDAKANEFKAYAAEKRLKQIFPKLNAKGVVLTIPMAGHPVPKDKEDQVEEAFKTLETLIEECDVVFQLTDSREARWLPTLIAQVKGKLCLNVALGFDTYVVLRHGCHRPGNLEAMKNNENTTADPERLGCYFCTDIVAPRDSLSDRTLDQQCTVTRPGLAPIASALSTELLVALIHSEEKEFSKSDNRKPVTSRSSNKLGLLPHQIRGYMTHFQNMLLKAPAFDQCPACCEIVVKLYLEKGWEFVLQGLNSPEYLEEVTGLSKLAMDIPDIDWISDDEGSI